jgi:hypothetical protein
MGRLFIASAIALALPALCSGQTLLGEGIESGGYGGPALRATSFNGDFGLMMGGQGAWVVGKRFGIGGAGFGLTTEHEVSVGGEEYELAFGYGGVMLEYFHNPDNLTHIHASLILGVGGVTLSQQGSVSDDNDTVFVIEPGIHLGLRVTEHFRVSALVGYRYVTGLSGVLGTLYNLEEADLSGAYFGMDFRFGKY